MKEVPNIITDKDLLYIKDMLSWNLITNKKIYAFLDCITDDDISKLVCKAKKMHAVHYQELLDILQ